MRFRQPDKERLKRRRLTVSLVPRPFLLLSFSRIVTPSDPAFFRPLTFLPYLLPQCFLNCILVLLFFFFFFFNTMFHTSTFLSSLTNINDSNYYIFIITCPSHFIHFESVIVFRSSDTRHVQIQNEQLAIVGFKPNLPQESRNNVSK